MGNAGASCLIALVINTWVLFIHTQGLYPEEGWGKGEFQSQSIFVLLERQQLFQNYDGTCTCGFLFARILDRWLNEA
jgi:hypothetical protein